MTQPKYRMGITPPHQVRPPTSTLLHDTANFKPGTSQDLDGIPPTAVVGYGSEVHMLLLNRSTISISSGVYLTNWKHSVSILYHMKGCLRDFPICHPADPGPIILRNIEKMAKVSSWTTYYSPTFLAPDSADSPNAAIASLAPDSTNFLTNPDDRGATSAFIYIDISQAFCHVPYLYFISKVSTFGSMESVLFWIYHVTQLRDPRWSSLTAFRPIQHLLLAVLYRVAY